MQHPGVIPLISNAPVTRAPAGEITLSCSRKFSSNANLTRSFLLFKINQKLCFPMKILCRAISKFYPYFFDAGAASKLSCDVQQVVINVNN